MGDRANIVVRQHPFGAAPSYVYMYSHSGGIAMLSVARKCVAAAKSRWSDEQYFTRIVFHTLLDGDMGELGFGLTTYLCDNQWPLILLDCQELTVSLHAESEEGEQRFDAPIVSWSFEEFLALKEPALEREWKKAGRKVWGK